MERGCSRSYAPSQPLRVRCELVNYGQPAGTDDSPTEFCGGIVQLDPRREMPSREQQVLPTQRTFCHINLPQGKQASKKTVLAIHVVPSGLI